MQCYFFVVGQKITSSKDKPIPVRNTGSLMLISMEKFANNEINLLLEFLKMTGSQSKSSQLIGKGLF